MALTQLQLQQHIGALVQTGVQSGQMTREEQRKLFSFLLSFADEYVASANDLQRPDRQEAVQTLLARAYQRAHGHLPSASSEAMHAFQEHWLPSLRFHRED